MDRLIYRVSAFPKGNIGGNEAGVVLETEGLSDQDMQKMAAHVGYSETAFLFPSDKADYRVRYFSPLTEVPLCGHATIATFNLLKNLDALSKSTYTIETSEGILTIVINEDSVLMEMASPSIQKGPSIEDVLNCMNIPRASLINNEVNIISTGIPEIFVEVDTLKTLHTLNPDPLKIQALSEKYNAKGVYVFTTETELSEADAQGRNFLPVIGIAEESATGTASGSLGVYMKVIKGLDKNEFLFEQGNVMDKPSLINVSLHLKDNQISTVYVGGSMRFIDKIVKYA